MIALDTNISNKELINLPFSTPYQVSEQRIHKKPNDITIIISKAIALGLIKIG